MSNLEKLQAYQIDQPNEIKGGVTVESCFYGSLGSGIGGGIGGAVGGATLGSALPVVGTGFGAIIGGGLGFIGGTLVGVANYCYE